MIDWYFAKLGPVIGLALIVSVAVMLVAAGLSVLVGGLDRDETKQRGFPIDPPPQIRRAGSPAAANEHRVARMTPASLASLFPPRALRRREHCVFSRTGHVVRIT